MAQYLPRFADSDQLPLTASATLTGGQLVTWAGAVAGDASTTVAGVVGPDLVSGQVGTIWRAGIHTAVAASTIAVGDPLCSGANGVPRKWISGTDPGSALIGRACSAATSTQSFTYALFGV